MAARINISVPDELHRELEQFRDRLNISEVCQDALRREVVRMQPPDGSLDVTDDIIDRLRTEKEEFERDSRERGFQTGLEWARRAKFRDLRMWGEREIPSGDQLKRLETPPYELVGWLWEEPNFAWQGKPEEVVERYPELGHLKVVRHWDGSAGAEYFYLDFGDKAAFNQGFLGAVKYFWGAVRERL